MKAAITDLVVATIIKRLKLKQASRGKRDPIVVVFFFFFFKQTEKEVGVRGRY